MPAIRKRWHALHLDGRRLRTWTFGGGFNNDRSVPSPVIEGIERLLILSAAGDDTINVYGTLGGAEAQEIQIVTGSGNDTVFSFSSVSNATFYGNEGDDSVRHVGSGQIDFFGGQGSDTLFSTGIVGHAAGNKGDDSLFIVNDVTNGVSLGTGHDILFVTSGCV